MPVKTYSLRRDGSAKVSPHFRVREFRCRDGSDKILIDTELVALLEKIRTKCGNKPVTITSAYRTTSHNNNVNGAARSQHLYGKAADIKVSGRTPSQVQSACRDLMYCGGLGFGRTFTHIDTRGVSSSLVTFNY